MTSVPTLISRGIRTAAAISPALAGDLAYRAFFSTSPRMPVRERDEATHSTARRSRLEVHGDEIIAYDWGSGPRSVLLLHGWRGRASQFAPLVRELVSDGFRVVAFDAPAHGSSGGRGTDILDWLDAAEQLQSIHGGFDAIIGHSFGALAALTAARTTVPTRTVVAIAGAASPKAFVDQFSRDFRLSTATRTHMEARFRARLGVDEAEMVARYDAVRHPLPEDTELLVIHDRSDQRMPDADSLRLHAAHEGRSRLLRTEGFGHTRVLQADAVLDAILEQLAGAGAESALSRRSRPRR